MDYKHDFKNCNIWSDFKTLTNDKSFLEGLPQFPKIATLEEIASIDYSSSYSGKVHNTF